MIAAALGNPSDVADAVKEIDSTLHAQRTATFTVKTNSTEHSPPQTGAR